MIMMNDEYSKQYQEAKNRLAEFDEKLNQFIINNEEALYNVIGGIDDNTNELVAEFYNLRKQRIDIYQAYLDCRYEVLKQKMIEGFLCENFMMFGKEENTIT